MNELLNLVTAQQSTLQSQQADIRQVNIQIFSSFLRINNFLVLKARIAILDNYLIFQSSTNRKKLDLMVA